MSSPKLESLQTAILRSPPSSSGAQWYEPTEGDMIEYDNRGNPTGITELSGLVPATSDGPATQAHDLAIRALKNFGERELRKLPWIAQETAVGQDIMFMCGHKTIQLEVVLIASNAWQ